MDVNLINSAPDDQYYNYCWWPYRPVSPTAGKLRPVSLLGRAFDIMDVADTGTHLVAGTQSALGLFRTVWGMKWNGQELSWEFYLYDYERRERTVSASRLFDGSDDQLRLANGLEVNESIPYFMFSFNRTAADLQSAAPVDTLNIYIGNPGSHVSSGISYRLNNEGMRLDNFYFFFNAAKDREEIYGKVNCSVHVDMERTDTDTIVWPELLDCETICLANKQLHDTVYFSGINVGQLLFFLRRLEYPAELTDYVSSQRAKLDHLLFDVGFDYTTNDGQVQIGKSGLYGIF